MIRILTIIGARPQIIKAAAFNRAVKTKFSNEIEELILHTGQHYDDEMSAFFFDELGIAKPDINLHVGSSSHASQTAVMMKGIEKAIEEVNPNYILVYGDTNSTLAAALVGVKMHVPIIHVEAGLRSFDKAMPEEINRITTDHCSTLLFSPTKTGIENLKNEGLTNSIAQNYQLNSPGVFHVGDIMLDNSLYYAAAATKKTSILEENRLAKNGFFLATVHRDNNTDSVERLLSIIGAFDIVTKQNDMKLVWPMHPRTDNLLKLDKYAEVKKIIDNNDRIVVLPPASFFEIIMLESHAKLILTDSGGVQKEAYFFKKPCLILRSQTEWVELVNSGHAMLCDANTEQIVDGTEVMLKSELPIFDPIFGQGNAAEEICEIILKSSKIC